MGMSSKEIYCFIEKYEPRITSVVSAMFTYTLLVLCLKTDKNTEHSDQLTKEEKKSLRD